MINLSDNIRSFLIVDSTLTSELSTFNNEKAIFTRRPIPTGADYPFIIISPQISSTESDFIDKLQRNQTYDIGVYAQNDTPENYRACERVAFQIQEKLARLQSHEFQVDSGWSLIQAVATGPIPFPTDDLNKVARGVTVTFNLIKD